MNYHQPTYTQVTQKALAKTLTEYLGPYQAALMQMLELEAISDGKYQDDVHMVSHNHMQEHTKNAVAHAVEILDLLNCNTHYDYISNRAIITKWFGNTVRHGKKEYVWTDSQWFVREWETVKMPKSKNKMATVYSRDFNIGQADSAGLSVLVDDGKVSKALTHGGNMEARTKITVSEQQKFLRGYYKHLDDAGTCEKYRDRSLIIRSRHRVVRTENVNACVREILAYSRHVILCGPTTHNDKDFYEKIGVNEIIDHLELISVMVHGSDTPVTFVEMDTRPFRYYYDTNPRNSHGHVAHAVAGMCFQLKVELEKL